MFIIYEKIFQMLKVLEFLWSNLFYLLQQISFFIMSNISSLNQYVSNTKNNCEVFSSSSSSSSSSRSSSKQSIKSREESPSEYRKGGYHQVTIGECYNKRYIVQKRLGFGYFSTVWLALDKTVPSNHPHKMVAIKISKSSESFQEAAKDEMKILNELKDCQDNVIQLLDQFIIKGPNGTHFCLVFEVMWKDLYHLIRKFNYRGLPPLMLKTICYQVLCGVEKIHEKQILHTDIKPENFLLSGDPTINFFPSTTKNTTKNNNKNTDKNTDKNIQPAQPTFQVKISDFGNACWMSKHFGSDITTRQYRSPEVLLGYPYGKGVDIFSCGTMFFELATGEFLFQPDFKEYDIDMISKQTSQQKLIKKNSLHLLLMNRTLGIIPTHMIKKGKYGSYYFNRKCEFLHFHGRQEHKSIECLLTQHGYFNQDASLFADFLSKLLEMDPQKRITAKEAKNHPWLKEAREI